MSNDIWEHQLIIIMRFWFLIVMNAIIHMPIHMFFFSAHILVGNQFAVVFPILKLLIVFNVSGGRIVFELELYKNTRIWDCAWCARNEGNNDRDVAKKKKKWLFCYVCVCVCAYACVWAFTLPRHQSSLVQKTWWPSVFLILFSQCFTWWWFWVGS